MEKIGWIVERKDKVNYFIKRFPLIGSFIKIQRPEKIDFFFTGRLVHEYRAFQVVIEPKDRKQESEVKYFGYKQGKLPFLPSKTWCLDLTKSEKKLLSEMHYKTRYNIRLARRLKIDVKNSKDIESFADFWQECAKVQRGMFLSQKKEIIELYKAFGEKAHLILAFENQALLSGILMVRTRDTAYYMYAASSKLGKKLFAPSLNTWETICIAKKVGCKVFDFEGIYDERFPFKSWVGFTRFKKSFGGKELEYPGPYSKYFLPF